MAGGAHEPPATFFFAKMCGAGLQAAIRCAVIRAELFPDRATAACGAIGFAAIALAFALGR
jgi:hypothetical protein